MKRTGIKPTRELIIVMALLASVVLAIKFIFGANQQADTIVSGFVIGLLCLVGFDARSAVRPPKISAERELPNAFSFNHWHQVELVVINQGRDKLQFQIGECLPNEFDAQGLNQQFTIDSKQQLKINYKLKAQKRGAYQVYGTELAVVSTWLCWQVYWRLDNPSDIKVYPSFNRLAKGDSLKGTSNLAINGLKLLKKRGEGIEFHQLREFRQGDSIRQIDWQATSKRQKLISKEYQEEQNQHVIVMLDAGQRMKIDTSVGSHFDAALSALLMLSHTVLKQGDWFSVQSFNQTERWLPAVKGAQNVSQIMNHFYDLYPDESATDYSKAVNLLLKKRSKRALVLLVTTLSDYDIEELLPALKRLQQSHLVALVNIEHQGLADAIDQPINNLASAQQYVGSVELKNHFQKNLKRIAKQGILTIDCKPEQLLPYLINTYLNVKHSGML